MTDGDPNPFDTPKAEQSSTWTSLKRKARASLFFLETEFPTEIGVSIADDESARRRLSAEDTNAASLFGDRAPPSHFNFGVFLFEFVTQALHPLLLPVVLVTQGRVAAENKGYLPLPGKKAEFVWNTINSLHGWVPQCVGLALKARWAATALVVSMFFVVFRYLIIGGKYASFRARDYRRVQLQPNFTALESSLIAVWKNISPDKIDAELRDVSDYVKINKGSSELKLVSGAYVSVEEYLRVLVHAGFGEPCPWWYDRIVMNFIQAGCALYPVWVYLGYFGTAEPDVLAIILTVKISTQLAMFAPAVISFLFIGYLSFRRQHACLRMLFDAIIRSGEAPASVIELDCIAADEDLEDDAELEVPRAIAPDTMFSLRVATNVDAFDKIRKSIRKFGWVYFQRISFNTFCTAIVLVFLTLVLLQQALAQRPDWKLFVFIAFIFLSCSIIVLSTLVAASQINHLDVKFMELLAHEEQAVLTEYLLNKYPSAKMQDASHDLVAQGSARQGEDESSDVEQLKDLLGAVKDSLELLQQVDPARVMFIPASGELISAFAGLVFSSLLVALQLATSGMIL